MVVQDGGDGADVEPGGRVVAERKGEVELVEPVVARHLTQAQVVEGRTERRPQRSVQPAGRDGEVVRVGPDGRAAGPVGQQGVETVEVEPEVGVLEDVVQERPPPGSPWQGGQRHVRLGGTDVDRQRRQAVPHDRDGLVGVDLVARVGLLGRRCDAAAEQPGERRPSPGHVQRLAAVVVPCGQGLHVAVVTAVVAPWRARLGGGVHIDRRVVAEVAQQRAQPVLVGVAAVGRRIRRAGAAVPEVAPEQVPGR